MAAPSSHIAESKDDMDHRNAPRPLTVALLFAIVLFFSALPGRAQSTTDGARDHIGLVASTADKVTPVASDSNAPDADASTPDGLPDAPQAAQAPAPAQTPHRTPRLNTGQQTKRILFIIPNFRAVSVDEKLPPLTAKEEIKLVLQDSFDYSSFIYVGIVAGIGQAENSYPEFGQGAAGYGRYYWHSMADAVDENLFTEFLVPYVTREDPRYYTLGRGGFAKRMVYSVSRLAITRNNNGK